MTAAGLRGGGAWLLLALLGVGCVQDRARPDAPSGPSELSLALTLSASPDVLPLDGESQSLIGIWARDAQGASVADLTLWLQIGTDAGLVDHGQLSSRQVVTGGDGRAAATYTVPLQSTADGAAADTGQVVTIWVTPVGDDFSNAVARSLDIRLVPAGTVIPPFFVTPGFEFAPATPEAFTDVLFTTTCVGGATANCVQDPNHLIDTYAWSFGDGAVGAGATTSHAYERAGTYVVTLTVSDRYGRSASVTRSVVVEGGTPPTADFTISPSDPRVSDRVFFNANGATAADGRRLVSYRWDFGDGGSGTGVTASHQYHVEGTYVVTLTVTDDQGQTGTASADVVVSASGVTAFFVVSPSDPVAGQSVFFDARGSEAGPGRRIVQYRWSFGDGGASLQGPRVSHRYPAPGTYTVQLTVRNDAGEEHSVASDVIVEP